jgi:glyoxylase-like metal-dependent hydrolase (beta-lactamase superfamily II)
MSSKGDELKKEYRLSREVLPDVYSIKLPLPGRKPGPVNAYLFKGEKNTLVDTGMLQTANMLKEALNEHGLSFFDIDKIIVTHGHPDHCGAAKKIVRAGRAKIVAHPGDKVTMESGRDVSYRRYQKFLHMIGVPVSVTILLGLLSFMFKFMSEGCKIDIVIGEGDEIEIGKYRAKIIETPGHSKGSICLFVEQGGMLFCGDTVIEHITPNAFIILDENEDLPVRLSQDEFYQSLDKIKKLSPSIIYSAHGKTVTDIDKMVAGYQKAFTERQEKVLSVIRGGGKNVYKIARRLFPEIGGLRLPLEIFLSISEVYTTLQVLQRDGKVSLNIKNGLLEVTEVIRN